MRSSYCRHGGFYTALLAASLRQMRRGLAGAKEGTASLVCTRSIATSPRAENSESDYAAAAYDPWVAERPAAA